MNLGDTTFTVYWIALLVSGVLLLVTAGTGFGRQSNGMRILNAVIGVAFLGYGGYLAFFFPGGHYLLMFKAFIVPIALLVNAVRGAGKKHSAPPVVYPTAPAAAPGPDSPHLSYLRTSGSSAAQPHQSVPGQPASTADYRSPVQPG